MLESKDIFIANQYLSLSTRELTSKPFWLSSTTYSISEYRVTPMFTNKQELEEIGVDLFQNEVEGKKKLVYKNE